MAETEPWPCFQGESRVAALKDDRTISKLATQFDLHSNHL
ncbi:hypothetical protein TG4357_00685 [Thalassovita gelatinovora]|uniref:Uncharacterized protein n=1 Tax=Thalassovita gelatinovora TaxID=53501 RepID=A0A0P1F681_THAGE|nr:hypothetical protein TG4357_00685 [Thalassovita gelatinovora]SEQ67296.1 hypothetical protein SAMN04488043_107188 [Thalassovita gelatinovora]